MLEALDDESMTLVPAGVDARELIVGWTDRRFIPDRIGPQSREHFRHRRDRLIRGARYERNPKRNRVTGFHI